LNSDGMFKNIAQTIKMAIMNLGYHNTYHELATQIEWEGKLVPMIYDGDGNLHQIMNLEEGGMGYTRKNGKITIRELQGVESTTSCLDENYLFEMNVPLRIFSSVPREDFQCDDPYTDDKHATELMSVLSGKPAGLALEISAKSVRFMPQATNTTSEMVWKEEVPGTEYRPQTKLSLVAMDLIVKVIMDKDCLSEACQY